MLVLEAIEKNDLISGTIQLPGSKSESNRALVIRSLCSQKCTIFNLSAADDTRILAEALNRMPGEINVGAAGTAMRFLAARLSIADGTFVLAGSERMHKRPIGPLAEALKQLGADITYLGKHGFPPLRITGKKLEGGAVALRGDISSQFITALLLIGPALKKGLHLHFTTGLLSVPYIEMTLKMMREFGAETRWEKDGIYIGPVPYSARECTIGSDWSAASYWFEIAALSPKAEFYFPGLRSNGLQGDEVISKLFFPLGITTKATSKGTRLRKLKHPFLPSNIELNCEDFPDLAPTLAVTFAALGIESRLTGLDTLRIKETDRIEAIKTELHKIGIMAMSEEPASLYLPAGTPHAPSVPFDTYEDHRMALAFAPLVLKLGRLKFNNPDVVTKSYPDFWKQLAVTQVATITEAQ